MRSSLKSREDFFWRPGRKCLPHTGRPQADELGVGGTALGQAWEAHSGRDCEVLVESFSFLVLENRILGPLRVEGGLGRGQMGLRPRTAVEPLPNCLSGTLLRSLQG